MPESAPVVLVTGGAKRIGAAIVNEFATQGYDVIVHCHASTDEAEATAELVQALGQQAWVLQADLGNADQTEGLVQQALDAAGKVDVLVNNASQFLRGRLVDASSEDLASMMQLHAFAPLALARGFAAGASAIVNILDTRVVGNDPEHFAYHLSKQTLHQLTKSLAVELAPTRVNAVAPGPILPPTDGSQTADSDLQKGVDATLLHRAGTPEEVAQATRFLAEAEYTTGQVLFVDGGRHLRNQS